ncbi:MAG: CDP-diacylglycerol--glycerol-3-phosphate 3-phosphatidyltransferase [Filifactoraceae bacterium]
MNTPNKLTVARLCLVPFFFVVAYLEKGKTALVLSTIIFALASATDFLDGYLARRDNLVTDFGKFMDPLADKVLVAAALVYLVQLGRAEAWIVVVIISREYAVSIIRAIAANKGTVIAASGGGKIKTVFQMLAILFLLLNLPFGNVLLYVCLVLTIYSGGEYIWKNRSLIAEK